MSLTVRQKTIEAQKIAKRKIRQEVTPYILNIIEQTLSKIDDKEWLEIDNQNVVDFAFFKLEKLKAHSPNCDKKRAEFESIKID